MSGSRVRTCALLWSLILVSALARSGSGALLDQFESGVDRDPERESRIRSALAPDRGLASQREAMLRRRAPGSLNLFVVGCDFSDSLMAGRELEQFPGWPPPRREPQRIPGTAVGVFDAHDQVYFDLQMRRVDAYFRTVSFGAFGLDWTVHPDIRNQPRPMGYFADRDSGVVRLARLAQDIAAELDDEVDFGRFDTLVIIHAGAGSETDVNGDSPDQIPSNYLDVNDLADAVEAGLLDRPRIVTAEREFEHVLVLPESETQDPLDGVPGSGFFDVRGVYCYEVGLRLGMLSLADFTPASYPDSQGIGNFGLMGYGLFTGLGIVPSAPSAINRMLMGWVDPVEVAGDAELRIAPMVDPATAAADTNLVRVPITDREYWLVEYRLQDPDGDLYYGFGDLNGNFFPDYYDQSNAANGGVPNSTYDPIEDQWEDEIGAEVDFFMSENPARPENGCRRGGGSGLYIWHVDEQIIQNALQSNTNTINSDPRHKGVDLEEADGIQDLDSSLGSQWLLGGDHDVWRGEGSHEFAPTTNPSTETATGISTGVRFSAISDVVVDSLPKVDGFCTGFVYAPAMTFRVEFGASGSGPREQSRWRSDGHAPATDLRVFDLGVAPDQPSPDGRDEIVALADSGRVLVFRGSLEGFGQEPLLAVAAAQDSIEWNGPAAIGDFDADGRPDLFAGAKQGIFGFDLDGRELADGDADPLSFGRLADPGGIGLSAVVVDEGTSIQSVQALLDLRVVAVDREPAGGVRILRTNPVGVAEGSGVLLVTDPPVAWTAFAGSARTGRARFDYRTGSVETDMRGDGFGQGPAALLRLPGMGEAAVWSDREGTLLAARAPDYVPERTARPTSERRSAPIAVPIREDGTDWAIAFTTANALWAFDANLSVRPGFPARGTGTAAAAPQVRLVEPVAVDLDGDGTIEFVWCDVAGGLHATDLRGREVDGWPVQGPASPVSAPAIGQFDDDPLLELVVAGRHDRLVEALEGPEGFAARRAGELRIYELPAGPGAFRPWSQAGAGPTNRSWQPLSTSDPTGTGVIDGSLSVRPNPATGATIRLRGDAAGAVEARLEVFTIEGERVLERGPFPVPAGTAFDEEFDIRALGSGTYICQLTVGGQVQRKLLSVVR